MARLTQYDAELVRCQAILAAILLMLIILLACLWRVQIAYNPRYENSLMRQSVRGVRWPGERGRLLDRRNQVLADNRPSYGIAIYLEEIREAGSWDRTIDKVEKLIADIGAVLGTEAQVTRDDIRMHIRKRLPLPFVVWRDVDQGALARLAESGINSPAVDVYVESVRTYPQGNVAAHLLGYVGRADINPDEDEPYDYYLPEMSGKSGVEKRMNDALGGEAGGRLIRVDARGFKHEVISERKSKCGQDVVLSIDTRIQRAAEEALAGQTGAVVVLDPRNGDVLALASSPSFNPNDFVPSIPASEWSDLIENPGKPLLNRALLGTYAPGSCMKPVIALAALESHRATEGTEFDCPGYFALGNTRFRCWNSNGHGRIALRKALEQSCNAYFAALGLQCGYDNIYRMAQSFGFGQRTGIDADAEAEGLLPNAAWKRRVMHDGWRDGDTCNASIGQGALAATPLQMALVSATIANGGHVYRPRLVLAAKSKKTGEFDTVPVQEVRFITLSDPALRAVWNGMHDVVEAPTGTGARARIAGVEMAGKTGTAEYGTKGSGRKHAWMIVFAPFDAPRYAVAMVIDDAVSGGVTVAPRIRRLMEGIFGNPEGAG